MTMVTLAVQIFNNRVLSKGCLGRRHPHLLVGTTVCPIEFLPWPVAVHGGQDEFAFLPVILQQDLGHSK